MHLQRFPKVPLAIYIPKNPAIPQILIEMDELSATLLTTENR